MKKIIILGAGLIGKAIAIDLCRRHDVTCADINSEQLNLLSLEHPVNSVKFDFRDIEGLRKLISPFDLVIGAVPGFIGFRTLAAIIESGKNVVDISFFPEDPFELDELAKKNNVIAVVDCGVAPGMCNVFAGYHNKKKKISRYECLVGGLPQKREWPFDYKAVFSPIDVLEEYTRPSRIVENSKISIKPALSEIEAEYFDEIGELESFNTDGLRTLIHTLSDVPDMKEKTMRYPGHAELMRVFRETGFFSKEPVELNGNQFIPLEVTSKLLFPKWKMKPGDEDITVMRVTIEDAEAKYIYTLHDKFDGVTQTTSMARTTGYTCTAVTELLLDGKFSRKGICPPEFVGEDENCLKSILKYLADRNIHYKKEVINYKEKTV